MVYVHVNEFAEEFKTTSAWLLEEAEAEFRKGDLVQASEKSWGAAAQYLKALATERDWGHDTHSHLVQAADRLAQEMGNVDMSRLFYAAESLHANIYQAHGQAHRQTHRNKAAVRLAMDDVRQYVSILANIPPPANPPRRSHVKARPLYKTRDGNP